MPNATNPHPGEPPSRTETDFEDGVRIARERMLLDEAREDVRAGRAIADEDVDTWLDRFVRDDTPPMPEAPFCPRVK